MKNITSILTFILLFTWSNNLSAQQDFYYITDAPNDALNGIYKKTENVEIHEKDFYVFSGPLPDKQYIIRSVESPFPMYQWKIVDTKSETVQFFTTETPFPNPPENDWRSKNGGALTVEGPMSKTAAEQKLTN